MMKWEKKSAFCLLIVVLAILAILAVPVSAAKLATPTITSPPNNFRYYDCDETIVLAWKPVPGATFYFFQIEKKSGTNWVAFSEQIYNLPFSSGYLAPGTYRWRIYANNTNPADASNPTPWRTITSGPEQKQLAIPIQVGPLSGTNFYHTPRFVRMDWKAVPGANRYIVIVQYFSPTFHTWFNAPGMPFIKSGTTLTGYRYEFPGPYQGRWCVQAQDSTGAWLDSNPTAWRTFTFKN